jgi:FlaA1/EpsC-like NDP-sugar epimerase/dTDP-4-amino-4,6-dideoxygalactose transaminase
MRRLMPIPHRRDANFGSSGDARNASVDYTSPAAPQFMPAGQHQVGGRMIGRGARTAVSGSSLASESAKSRGSRLAQGVYRVVRGQGAVTLALLEGGIVACAWLVSLLAGFEGRIPSDVRGWAVLFVVVPATTQVLAHHLLGLYESPPRFSSVDEAVQLMRATAFATLVSGLALWAVAVVADLQMPLLSAPPVAALLILLGCGGIRFQERLFALERTQVQREGERLRTLVVGADASGNSLTAELLRGVGGDVVVVGIVDDDKRLVRRSLGGVPVLGTTEDLERICREQQIDRVLIALPNAPRDYVRAVVRRALKTDAQVKVLPDPRDLVDRPQLTSLRDLDLADLLGREHAPVDTSEISDYLRNAVVLVTGAGGSIGSEIARQVSAYEPARLVLVDRDETLLHDAAQSLTGAVSILADVRDDARLRMIFERYRPDVVFHAAAYKHVPILEHHPVEAVQTNILATWSLATLAAKYNCRFVHISSDKAARPCSVMGATKRAAEIIVNGMAADSGLQFAAVRFGNVLGSRGSVVPTFFRQIMEGGPVSVTDPEMERFFMTIPEAVSLVLQAGAMADEPHVFLLDMGQPIAIMDLARQMIRLAGLRPGCDIEIEVVGMRPGERLQEPLHDDAEIVRATEHPSISALCARAGTADAAAAARFVEQLRAGCDDNDDVAVAALLEQFLCDRGVDCELQSTSGDLATELADEEIDLTADEPAADTLRRRYRAELPALLGGPRLFPAGMPFARPARPPLERVAGRLGRSYARGVLTNGPLVAELEERMAARLGVADVVAVNSCTSGLILVLQALTEGRPGPVVVPSFTFSATAHSVLWNQRVPRFVDCDPRTFQVDVAALADALDGASAVVATHVFGAPCAPERVVGAAADLPVVFDAAHALGAATPTGPVGRFGSAEVFSLSPTKALVAGEGGLVATDDADLARRLRYARNYGDPGDYDTRFPGLNARMSEIHAALALESLDMLDETLRERRALADAYRRYLHGVPGIAMQTVPEGDVSTHKDLTIALDADEFGLTRDALVCVLAAEGIETRAYFDPPVHLQHAYRHVSAPPLPVTEALASSVVSLPLHLDMREEDVAAVADAVSSAHSRAGEIVRWLQLDVGNVAEAG